MPVLTSTASGSGLQRAELSPTVSGSGRPPAEPRATVDRPRSVDSEPHTFRGVLQWAVQALDGFGALLRRMLEQVRDLRELLCRVLDDRDVLVEDPLTNVPPTDHTGRAVPISTKRLVKFQLPKQDHEVVPAAPST